MSVKQYYYRSYMNENSNITLNGEACQIAQSFRQQKILIFINLVLALTSLLTLFVVHKVCKCKRIYMLVDLDLKIVFIAGLLMYVISSVNSLIFHGVKFVSLHITC